MEHEILEKINNELSFEELSAIAKTALSALYRKLREEEGFGYYQRCFVTSIGSEEYDVDAFIIDGGSHATGTSWTNTFWL